MRRYYSASIEENPHVVRSPLYQNLTCGAFSAWSVPKSKSGIIHNIKTLNAMTKVTASFENQTVYVGLDMHKRSWNAAIYLED